MSYAALTTLRFAIMRRTGRVKGRTRKSLRKRFRGNIRRIQEKQRKNNNNPAVEKIVAISKHQAMDQSQSVCLLLI